MASLIRQRVTRFGDWRTVLRVCAVLWAAALIGIGLSVIQNFGFPLFDFPGVVRYWKHLRVDGYQWIAGAQFAFLTLVFCVLMFTCWRLFLLRLWAALVVIGMSWSGVWMLAVALSVGAWNWTLSSIILILVSLLALPLTAASVLRWHQMRENI